MHWWDKMGHSDFTEALFNDCSIIEWYRQLPEAKLCKQSNKQPQNCVTGICDSENTYTKYQFGVEGVL